ncbi:hypothetical protein [Bradyrhizobium sp. Ash2021]|uniref:hypothetical protein n=1 Tax=Bradyrhizobium sp. Ash2021 TaxID=2954771 RepID=UPI002814CC88|nr:hypothetical protein [Bradyrhizobium sp. Ash2021]WMT73864.1 hypothetical protein NL528_39095 [Bradyrhizobium sp. Ash2021]
MKKTERKRSPATDVRLDLQDFIRFLRETGEKSLEVKFDLPEREALQHAVQELDPATKSLIGVIERSGIPDEAREVAMHNLWSALASAYMIGSEGTISDNTEVAIANKRTDKMRGAKSKRQQDNPENKIIWEAALRNRAAGESRLYKAADVVVNEALPVLRARGCELTDKAVRGRAVRMLKKLALQERA